MTRPLRTAIRMWFALSALPAIGFVLAPMPVWSCFVGSAYCLFLALFAVGFVLAGRPARWWLFSTTLPMSAMLGVLQIQLWSDPEAFFQVLERVGPGLLAVIYTWLAASVVVAGAGWVRYIRTYRSEGAAVPGATPDPVSR